MRLPKTADPASDRAKGSGERLAHVYGAGVGVGAGVGPLTVSA